jgi:RNA polymerase sigma factor (sigma-70 family)
MMMIPKMSAAENNDAQLVEGSLTGDRDAFARIVKRYQSLVCSITYNATGSLSLSEDLAQETFLAAWKQLPELREPSKLRSWLCAITRFLVGKELRRRGREPMHAAEPLDRVHDSPSLEPSPSAEAVSREQEAILWGALQRIPEVYREPLILFYREQQSVERVAAELELSEDAVKQRLSRGRKLLHEEVIAFVEGTLSRSAPGRAFSEAVLAALPAAPAATAGAGLAGKGTAAAKSGFLGMWLAPAIGMVGGIAAHWLIVRAAPTDGERRVERSAFIAFWIFVLGWCVGGQSALRAMRPHFEWSDRTFYAVMAGFWWFSAVVAATWTIWLFRRLLAIRRQGAGTQLSWGARVAVVAGVYLGFFSWLIALAWRAHDHVSAGIIAGTMVVLGVLHFFQLRGRGGAAAMWAALGRIGLIWGIILVVLNLRLAVWLAAIRGTDLAGIHGLLPAWVFPSLTFALLIWVGVVFAVTKPKRSDSF